MCLQGRELNSISSLSAYIYMYISEFIPPLWFQQGYFRSELQTSMNQRSWNWVWTTTEPSIMKMQFSNERNKASPPQPRMVRTSFRRTPFFSIWFYYELYHLFSWFFLLWASDLLMQHNRSSGIIVANRIPVADVKSIFIFIKYSVPLIRHLTQKVFKKSWFWSHNSAKWRWCASLPAAAFWNGRCSGVCMRVI